MNVSTVFKSLDVSEDSLCHGYARGILRAVRCMYWSKDTR